MRDEHGVNRHYTVNLATADVTADTKSCDECGFERFAWVDKCPRCERTANAKQS